MVPSHPVFRLYPPLPKVGVSAAKNCKIPEKRAQFEKAKTAFVCVGGGILFGHADLDSLEQRTILPDYSTMPDRL